MPFTITKKRNGRYQVSSPTHILAKDTTLAKAEKQVRLLNMVEFGGKRPATKRAARSSPRNGARKGTSRRSRHKGK